MSGIEERVCEKVLERAKVGRVKYGVTMQNADLPPLDWMNHLQEELMDAVVYLQKIIELKTKLNGVESMKLKVPVVNEEVSECKNCGLRVTDLENRIDLEWWSENDCGCESRGE